MKKKIITLCSGTVLCLVSSKVFSQTGNMGINTPSPHPSAALDVTASNKGFLPPRVALRNKSDIWTIPKPATGLLVYNTKSAGVLDDKVIANNYYTFDGTSWSLLLDEKTIASLKIPQLGGYIYVREKEYNIPCGAGPTALSFNYPSKTYLNYDIIERDYTDDYNFRIKKTGRMTVVGFTFVLVSTETNEGTPFHQNSSTNWIAGIQKSTDNGVTWTYEAAQRTPIYSGATTFAVNIPFNGALNVNEGDLIRFAVGNTVGEKPKFCKISYPTGLPDSYGFTFHFYER